MAVRAETQIDLARVDDGSPGTPGANGATFTPSVDSAGNISWTNDGGLPNPPTQNIMGPSSQYFWYETSGADAGAHITEVPQDEWTDVSDPNYHSGTNLLARSGGLAVRNGLVNVATFGVDGARIGSETEARAELQNDSFELITDNQIVAFSMQTSGKQSESSVVLADHGLLPSVSTPITFSALYTSLPNGTPLELKITRYKQVWTRTSPTSGGMGTSREAETIQLIKGISKSGTFTTTFVVENAVSIDDDETLTISYNFDGTDLTITTPNYFYDPDMDIPDQVGVSTYNNYIAAVIKTSIITSAPLVIIQGETQIRDNLLFDVREYADAADYYTGEITTSLSPPGYAKLIVTTTNGNYTKQVNDVVYIIGDYNHYTGTSQITFNIDSTGETNAYYNGYLYAENNGGLRSKQVVALYYDGSNYQVFALYSTDDHGGDLMYNLIKLGWESDVLV